MSRFIEGQHRQQSTLSPERIDDYITDENPVKFVDAFVNKLYSKRPLKTWSVPIFLRVNFEL